MAAICCWLACNWVICVTISLLCCSEENWAIWAMNAVSSIGCIGSWFCICVARSCMKSWDVSVCLAVRAVAEFAPESVAYKAELLVVVALVTCMGIRQKR